MATESFTPVTTFARGHGPKLGGFPRTPNRACASYWKEYGLTFNAKESKIMVFSKNNVNMADLTYRILLKLMVVTLSNEYTDTITYLDTSIVSKKGIAFFSMPCHRSSLLPSTTTTYILKLLCFCGTPLCYVVWLCYAIYHSLQGSKGYSSAARQGKLLLLLLPFGLERN